MVVVIQFNIYCVDTDQSLYYHKFYGKCSRAVLCSLFIHQRMTRWFLLLSFLSLNLTLLVVVVLALLLSSTVADLEARRFAAPDEFSFDGAY